MSNTFFELGGKCPRLLIIRGEDVLIYHFHRGGGGQMSEGANVLHSDQTWATLQSFELVSKTCTLAMKYIHFSLHSMK